MSNVILQKNTESETFTLQSNTGFNAYLDAKNRIMSSPENRGIKIPTPNIPIIISTNNTTNDEIFLKNNTKYSSRYESPPLIDVTIGNNHKYSIEGENIKSLKTPINLSNSKLNSPSLILQTNSQKNYINSSFNNIASNNNSMYNKDNFSINLNNINDQIPIHRYRQQQQYQSPLQQQYQQQYQSPLQQQQYQSPLQQQYQSPSLQQQQYQQQYQSPSLLQYQHQNENNKDKILYDLSNAVKILLDDHNERKQKERDNEEKIKMSTKIQNSTPSFTIPQPESFTKRKQINFDGLNQEQLFLVRERFKLLFRDLINKYPKWNIEEPNYTDIPLKIIHESYEKIIKTICIYQNAMKWKVYLVIIFAGIEYYGYNIKKFEPLQGLLKNQIKTIHKYEPYLLEFSAQFYEDGGEGEEWPLWMRFLGTLLSGLSCFSCLNGFANKTGFKMNDFLFEQADKFVSPTDGPAKLYSDGISDVPEPPSGFQDPNTLIGFISNLFSFGKKDNSGNNQNTNNNQNSNQSQAKPHDDGDEDLYNAEF